MKTMHKKQEVDRLHYREVVLTGSQDLPKRYPLY